ncbi:hypothetical protein PENNAL_c0427G04605, partial [Penicillium nalgiovense]
MLDDWNYPFETESDRVTGRRKR